MDQSLTFAWSFALLATTLLGGAAMFMITGPLPPPPCPSLSLTHTHSAGTFVITEADTLYDCGTEPVQGCHDGRGCYIDGYAHGRNVFKAVANTTIDSQPDE